jgi:hypothetical protein
MYPFGNDQGLTPPLRPSVQARDYKGYAPYQTEWFRVSSDILPAHSDPSRDRQRPRSVRVHREWET